VNEAKRRLLIARAFSDVTSAQSALVVRLADSLQIFEALRGDREMTAEEVANRCGIPAAQAAAILLTLASGGYVDADPPAKTYSLSAEQTSLFADADGPLFMGGAFQLAVGLARNDAIEIAEGISRSSRAKFPDLVSRKLGSRLGPGGRILEIGCGDGAALIEIVRRHPHVHAVGIDRNGAAIEHARASSSTLRDRVAFRIATMSDLDAESFEIILCLESFHEFAGPAEVARAVFRALKPGGVWLLVEPCRDGQAGTDVRFLASLAALYCLPASGFDSTVLGPLASKAAYEKIVAGAGFQDLAVENDGPIHVIIQARK